jgi:hypothetical protein
MAVEVVMEVRPLAVTVVQVTPAADVIDPVV